MQSYGKPRFTGQEGRGADGQSETAGTPLHPLHVEQAPFFHQLTTLYLPPTPLTPTKISDKPHPK